MTQATLPAQVAAGVLDAELGGLVWLLVEGGVPLNVIGPAGSGQGGLRSAVLAIAGVAPDHAGDVRSAESLEDLLAGAAGPMPGSGPAADAGGVPDGLRGLGLVLVMGIDRGMRRLVAAHYIRPVERDREGHLQRRPPALLSARDAAADRLEHFHWAIAPELAERASLTIAEFERRRRDRSAFLADLAGAGIHDEPSVARALRGFALGGATGGHEGH